jgi:hypothetical protein
MSIPVRHILFVGLALHVVLPAAAPAQAAEPRRADVSVELATTHYGELEETTVGAGARLSFRLLDWLAVDGGLVFASSDLGQPAFSTSQMEGLFGLRAGPRVGAGSVYVSARSGFLRFSGTSELLICIAIYPPPLRCVLAAGHTAFALNFGGGGEIPLGPRFLLRLELGDLMVKYPGPALGREEVVLEESFWRHSVRGAVSVGFRF